MQPMDEEAASGLGARIVEKINDLITYVTKSSKADVAWKTEAEQRLKNLEADVAILKAQNRGLKISKGKAVSAQRKVEAKLDEARRLLN
jgi:uncharacterized protein involved in exopolysaccharide biosynthesis